MQIGSGEPLCGRVSKLVLAMRVHFDALRSAPLLYLQGIGWRTRGLKLRSRHRLSALKGHSPHAYGLWIATREGGLRSAFANTEVVGEAIQNQQRFYVVIDCRLTGKGLSEALRSIADAAENGCSQDVHTLLLGCEVATDIASTTARRLEDVGDLRQHLAAIAEQEGGRLPWVLTMQPGDRLASCAFGVYRAAISRNPDASLLYADDDLIDARGRRTTPHFKPQWNAELARYHDFLTDSCIFRCDPGQVREDWPGNALPVDEHPLHIPFVLHHRDSRPVPRPPLVPLPSEAPGDGDWPNVSIIVPTRDQVALLRTCMEGLAMTDYPCFDISIINNDSVDPETLGYLEELKKHGTNVIPYPGPFNYAAMHNAVVASTQGPLLCLLNNDIEINHPDWLRIMVRDALRDDIGAVGARLLYPDRTIQHAGIVIGIGGGAAHAHRFQPDEASGYFDRAHMPQFVSAVTAACLVVAKERFQAVGGFDADNFTVAFNDVDLCLKLNARGWQSFYEPRAVLIHHESKSRGTDYMGAKKIRFAGELAALKRIWQTDRRTDPYHHPELSPFSEQFVVRL